jgi:hypothetical protein
MGIVTDYVLDMLRKHVEDYRLIVWYDPGEHYGDVATSLQLPESAVARYDGSFLQLRRDIDHLLNGEEAPRLVVYVPEDQAKTHHALVELDAAGVVIQPGQQPPRRNTRLSIVARNALKSVLGEETALDVAKQVEAGNLTLAELNALAEKGGEISSLLTPIFGTGHPQEVALLFLGSDRFDDEIANKSAEDELVGLLARAFDVGLSATSPLGQTRDELGRHVLLTDLIESLGVSAPPLLKSVPVATSAAGVDACLRLARTWRQLRDHRHSYLAAAAKVEASLPPVTDDAWPGVGRTEETVKEADAGYAIPETLIGIERAVLRDVEQRLLEQPSAELLELAEARLAGFWSDATPAIQAHWALILAAGRVLVSANRVQAELNTLDSSKDHLANDSGQLSRLIQAYAQGDSPWCLLDTHHRHMESRWQNFDPAEEHEGLEKLVVKSRQRYMQVGSAMAKHFVTQFSKTKHPVTGVLRQRDIFGSHVQPKLEREKTAYVWVDALRFEMARELCEVLKDDPQVKIEPAIATVPTITEIGMASLLPKAGQGRVVSMGGGKLALDIGGTVIKGRKDRVNFLREVAGADVFEAKLDALLPKPSKQIREGIRDARLVLITSQEIDELCEQDNISQARRQMDGVLVDLRRGVRVLAELGVKSIILTADHGHLFAEEISDDMKIDAPGGETADLHRRVWVGVGGTQEPSYLRTSLSSLGVESEFDIATPWNFACFKVKGGARAYFHGGMSPQELIVPVVSLAPSKKPPAATPTPIDWKLTTGTPKLTTRFFSVQVTGKQAGLFGLEPPKVRVEIRAKGKPVSRPVSASYGFEDATGEVELRARDDNPKEVEPNTVALMIVEEISQNTVALVLLDASSGAELASLDRIDVAISI